MSTLAQLRSQTSVWLDDPKLTRFDAPLLNTLLNMAYPMIVGMIEGSGRLWNLSATPIVISVTPTARTYTVEYLVDAGPQTPGGMMHTPRRIVDVRRVQGTTRTQLSFVVLTEANLPGMFYPSLNGAQAAGVSLYRTADGTWMLRFVEVAPAAQTLEVDYIPEVDPLLVDEDVPTQVPSSYHHVVAMQAAIIGKGTEERVNSTLELHFAQQVKLMLGEASNLVAARSQRI